MKKFIRSLLGISLASVLVFAMAGCSAGENESAANSVVNIGVTDSLGRGQSFCH